MWVRIGGLDFPRPGWVEDVFTVLMQWVTQLACFHNGGTQNAELWFWRESFYYLQVERTQDGTLSISATDKEGTQYRRVQVLPDVLVNQVIARANQLIDSCKQRGALSESKLNEFSEALETLKTSGGLTDGNAPTPPEGESQICFATLDRLRLEALLRPDTGHRQAHAIRDKAGMTPLHAAAWNSWQDLVEKLISAGADIDARGSYWWDDNIRELSPLHMAAWAGRRDVANFLIKHGADVNAVDSRGNSVLHYASASGDRPTCILILNQGGNSSKTNANGLTPRDVAAQEDQEQLVQLLSSWPLVDCRQS
jgi:ankyrin repeat protein